MLETRNLSGRDAHFRTRPTLNQSDLVASVLLVASP